jgi:hypothetical protein
VHSELAKRRVERNSALVFTLAMCATAVVILVGFGLAAAACSDAFNDLTESGSSPKPIPIPQAACPYLRLVSVAAANAGAPWSQVFDSNPPSWAQFSSQLRGPLGALDIALGDAIPHVPVPVANDLSTVRLRVENGRRELEIQTSVTDYLDTSGVADGYLTLQHASALVDNACGFTLAPAFP